MHSIGTASYYGGTCFILEIVSQFSQEKAYLLDDHEADDSTIE